jgi:hypothetical protein
MQIKIRVNGLDEIRAMAQKYPDISKTQTNWAIRRSIIALQGDSMRNAPKDTGYLAGHITTQFGDYWGILDAGAEYSLPVHEGSKPHFPPTSVLVNWVSRKFGVSGTQAKSIAFLIARKIARTGTKGRPFMGDAVRTNERNIQVNFDTALENIIKQL